MLIIISKFTIVNAILVNSEFSAFGPILNLKVGCPLDSLEFVQNVKKYCTLRDVKPTVACRESGVGTSFINNIEKGSAPSVDKVQKLATYLGVTTSELLGEEKKPTPCPGLTAKEAAVIDKYRSKPELQPAVDILLGLDEQPPA